MTRRISYAFRLNTFQITNIGCHRAAILSRVAPVGELDLYRRVGAHYSERVANHSVLGEDIGYLLTQLAREDAIIMGSERRLRCASDDCSDSENQERS
jgi:hypothetical protein